MTDIKKIADGLSERLYPGPYDICHCGDYRIDHKNGTGPCRHNSRAFDLCHAGQDCMKFRPANHPATGDAA